MNLRAAKYFALNATNALCLYFWLVEGSENAENLYLFLTCFFTIGYFFVFMGLYQVMHVLKSTQEPPQVEDYQSATRVYNMPVPYEVDVFYDICIILTLAWFGQFVLATVVVFQAMFTYGGRSSSKEIIDFVQQKGEICQPAQS